MDERKRARKYHSPLTRNWERRRRNRALPEIEDDFFTDTVSQKKGAGEKSKLSTDWLVKEKKRAHGSRSARQVRGNKSEWGPENSERAINKAQKNVQRGPVGGKSQLNPEISESAIKRAQKNVPSGPIGGKSQLDRESSEKPHSKVQRKRSDGLAKLSSNKTQAKPNGNGSLHTKETTTTNRKTTQGKGVESTSPLFQKNIQTKSPIIRNTQPPISADTKLPVQASPKKSPQKSAPRKPVSKPFDPLREAKDLDAYINSIIDDL